MARTLRTFAVVVSEIEVKVLDPAGQRVKAENRVQTSERVVAKGTIQCSTAPDAKVQGMQWAEPHTRGRVILGVRFGQRDGVDAVLIRTAKSDATRPGTFTSPRTRK